MAHYRLSGRQRKQLIERSGVLRIAIPLPLEWPDESTDDMLRRLVVKALPDDVVPSYVRDVEETLIGVVPNTRSHPLGVIVMGKDTRNRLHLAVSVVIATLSVDENPRHSSAPIQWPGDVSLFLPSGE